MSNTDLTARISKFLDRKASKTISVQELSHRKQRQSHRDESVVFDTQYIVLDR